MNAIAVFPESKELRLIDHLTPRIDGPSSVLLRVLDVGVCGTDREIARFEYGTPPPGSPFLVTGHEALAEVVEVGSAVETLRTGDLVVPMVRRPCRHESCTACRKGRQDFCFTGDFRERGIKEAHGFMTQLIVEDQRYLVPVAREARPYAVLLEPLTIAEKAMAQLFGIQERLPWECDEHRHPGCTACRRAVVLGAGPVGLLGAMALRRAGFQTFVYARTPAPNPRAEIAQLIGARYVSSEEVPVERLPDACGGEIDVVYEAVGASEIGFEVLAELGTNGVFIFTGVPGRKAPVTVDTDRIMRNLVLRNQVVFGTVNAGRDAFEAASADLSTFSREWPEALSKMITGRHPMTAFRELLLDRPRGIKDVIAIG